jgi:hypothetical protein
MVNVGIKGGKFQRAKFKVQRRNRRSGDGIVGFRVESIDNRVEMGW